MQAETVRGIVTRSTESGLQLEGYPGVWFNRSRAEWDRTGGMPFPGDGCEVEVVYQLGGGNRRYVQQFSVLDGGSVPPPVVSAPVAAPVRQAVSRDETITRLACLRDAIRLAAAFPNLVGDETEIDVKRLAERLVTWVHGGLAE